jgi:hypothetical protein
MNKATAITKKIMIFSGLAIVLFLSSALTATIFVMISGQGRFTIPTYGNILFLYPLLMCLVGSFRWRSLRARDAFLVWAGSGLCTLMAMTIFLFLPLAISPATAGIWVSLASSFWIARKISKRSLNHQAHNSGLQAPPA